MGNFEHHQTEKLAVKLVRHKSPLFFSKKGSPDDCGDDDGELFQKGAVRILLSVSGERDGTGVWRPNQPGLAFECPPLPIMGLFSIWHGCSIMVINNKLEKCIRGHIIHPGPTRGMRGMCVCVVIYHRNYCV